MSPSGSNLKEQLSYIMDVLAKAAVSEICQLFSEGSTSLRLQITHSLEENEALRKRMKVMKSELFSLRLQTRSNAPRVASRFALARANICKPRTKPLGNEHCDAFGDRRTRQGAYSESLRVDAPGSSHMSSLNGEQRILSVHVEGEGPLAIDGHDTLFTASELEALSSPSADHVHREQQTVQLHTPVAVFIKDEEDIGGGMDAEEHYDAFGDRSTQQGAYSESLRVDAPGSSHMSSLNGEQRILSVHVEGEGPLAVDGHDTLFTASELEALSSLSADQVHREQHAAQLHTPVAVFIKDEEDIGGGMDAEVDCNDIRDCSTQRGANSQSLCVDAPGSSHMSSLNGELRILSVHGKGQGPLAVDGRDTLFTVSEVEALSPLSADQSLAMSLDCGERLVHREVPTGPRGGRKGCVVCGREFPNYAKVMVHMRTHTGEKPYGCDQCQMRFQQKSNLKLHMRTHSGEKPFRCDQCVRRFSQKSNLKIHLRTHSGEKPCVCLQCNVCFSDPSNLLRHMLKHTGNGTL
ncbi:uncharacterized protein LOC132465723 [Gadus macrocephalus]|uniref:uncharacterized protein LOC132465723 n=1 Tax=Gadus macrocephalus TaxID=80720 RepID=UPI0028CB59C7|nr:uncharacterized protein LOC132465723 [Gadus macrocephalus]